MKPGVYIAAQQAVTLNAVQSLIVEAHQHGPKGHVTVVLQLCAFHGGHLLHPAVIEVPARVVYDVARALDRVGHAIGAKR